jgi:hypothetical protein
VLAEARKRFAQLLEELRRLDSASASGSASADLDARKAHLLNAVLPVLETSTRSLRDHSVDVDVAPLEDLVNALKTFRESGDTTDARLGELWDRTLRVLDDFVQARSEPQRGPRRSFWKRPR